MSQYRSIKAFHRGGAYIREFEVTPDEAKDTPGAPSGELAQLFFSHDGREVQKWLHYLDAYERHFARFRCRDELGRLRFLEIGVRHGGSLQLWRKYFGPQAIIFGVDVDPRCDAIQDPDFEVRIGSQSDARFLQDVVSEMGGVDIVLDDGSHNAPDQRAAFDALFPLLSDGGLYVVEDVHTSYWRRFRGAYRRRGTFIEFSKDMIDGMHAWYYRHAPPRLAAFAKTDVASICFYDSIVFIERRLNHRPQRTQIGRPSF